MGCNCWKRACFKGGVRCYWPMLLFVSSFLDHIVAEEAKAKEVFCPLQCTCIHSERILNCSNRSLRKIPRSLPQWVEILSFRNNKITGSEIRSVKFQNLRHLRELDFSDNRLNRVNLTLFRVPALRVLKFDRCSLDGLPILTGGASVNITKLSLSRNSITNLGVRLKHWPALQELDLSFNRIRRLHNYAFSRQNKLKRLYLHKNKISIIESRAFRGVNSLRVLSLSRNRIRDLKNLTHSNISEQPCIGDLRNLQYLDLSRNQLSRVEGLTFQGMCVLETLLLNNNNIATLRDGTFYSLKKLTTLNLDENLITSVFKEWLYDLESLQILSLSHNNISTIRSNAWKFSLEIRQLNLSYNDLTLIPRAAFQQLTSLIILNISHNSINVLEDEAFITLSSLTTLDISFNQISSFVEDISGAFTGLASLRQLNLSSNKIRTLSPLVLSGVEGLNYLDLTGNDITSIQNRTFDVTSELQTLLLDSSALLCDCQLAWFAHYLRLKNMSSPVGARCFHPPKLKDRPISSISPHEFECGEHPVPALLHQPTLLTSYKEDNVTLECRASATLSPSSSGGDRSSVEMSVVWRRGPTREEIRESPSVRILNQQKVEGGHIFFSSLLLLYKIKYKDEDDYSCVIRNDFGHAKSPPARLKVIALPRITMIPEDKTVKFGTEVVIDCQASGHPLPVISWEKEGGTFPAADERRLILDHDTEGEGNPLPEGGMVGQLPHTLRSRPGGLSPTEEKLPSEKRRVVTETTKNVPLHIVKLKPVDAGKYKCTAKSDVGAQSAYATLEVLYPPKIDKMPEELTAAFGGNAVLKCMTSAFPAAQVKWYMNASALERTARHFFAADGQLLVIVDAGSYDEGTYTCSASNVLGVTKSDTKLILVQGNPSNPGSMSFLDKLGIPGLILAVLACVLLTSLLWLAVICCTRRNVENAYSTNTDSTELNRDDQPHDGAANNSCQAHWLARPSLTNAREDLYYEPDLISPCMSEHTAAHQLHTASIPRSFMMYCGNRDRMRSGPPSRAASTSHMCGFQVDTRRLPTSFHRSEQCIHSPATGETRRTNAASRRQTASHTRRKRRTKRAVDEKSAPKCRGDDDSVCNSPSSSDAEVKERDSFLTRRPQRTMTTRSSTLANTIERTLSNKTIDLGSEKALPLLHPGPHRVEALVSN